MLEQIKKIAMQQLAEKMASNSLGQQETQNAANQGASQLINSLTEGITNGQLCQITSLFSNDGNSTQSNPLFQGLQGKMADILQNQGMAAPEAQNEAQHRAPEMIDAIKERFLSDDPKDREFDLGSIAELAGGKEGLMNMAKSLFN